MGPGNARQQTAPPHDNGPPHNASSSMAPQKGLFGGRAMRRSRAEHAASDPWLLAGLAALFDGRYVQAPQQVPQRAGRLFRLLVLRRSLLPSSLPDLGLQDLAVRF